ncbi:MAG: hypothetical protein CBC12_03035 [Candidatus Puniceispirillum sp. TMED52]|nr:hypothetical protein [SAR116 cluster bacterium]OUU53038.1 MAG: hypothetical protein CBC12_03035 [Candidatus Puniceispirillum sp. TMED52]
MTRIAIIGAGMAGVTLATLLKDKADIIVIEKSRGVSGRLAHRRAAPFGFDHGAAYMTIRDHGFADMLAPYQSSGLLQQWPQHPVRLRSGDKPEPLPPKPDSYAVSGTASALIKAMIADHLPDIDMRLATKAVQITRDSEAAKAANDDKVGWRIVTEDSSAPEDQSDIIADWVISTAPAPQTAALLPRSASFHQQLSDVETDGCFTLMLGFDTALNIGWDAAWGAHDQPLGFISDNRTKPERDQTRTALTIHAGNIWSSRHLTSNYDDVKARMIAALYTHTGINAATATHIGLQRWLYANPSRPLHGSEETPFVMDTSLRLAAAGDWCLGGRIENAYLSGSALARALLPLI